MVEVFKTNVEHRELAEQLASILRGRFAFCKINFDLEDCDRILRIESAVEIGEKIEEEMNRKGFYCQELY